MKKFLLLTALCLIGCESRVASTVEATPSGHLNINGKDCSVHMVNVGDGSPRLYFIDCGPGTSAVTFQSGKNQHTTVGQYNPPPTPEVSVVPDAGVNGCGCPTNTAEEMKKIQDVKKNFYK